MKTVIAIYIVAILALAGGLIYMNNAVNSLQHEIDTAGYAPLVVQDSGREIVSTEAYQGGTGYGVDDLQQATITIE